MVAGWGKQRAPDSSGLMAWEKEPEKKLGEEGSTNAEVSMGGLKKGTKGTYCDAGAHD